MNDLRSHVARLVVKCLVLLMSAEASAATKSYHTYKIDRAWFDSAYIYLLYKDRFAEVSYDTNDINGTLVKEESKQLIKRIPRTETRESRTINLETGDAADSAIYVDSDFAIYKTDTGVMLSGRSTSTLLPPCERTMWLHNSPIRMGDRLFYCGIFFNASGNIVSDIPQPVTHAIEQKAHPREAKTAVLSALLPTSLLFAFAEEKLLVTLHRPGSPIIRELDIAAWNIERDQAVSWHKTFLPESVSGYKLLNSAAAYCPKGGVLLQTSPLDKGEIILCDETKCTSLGFHTGFAYLLIDNDSKEIFAISQNNLTSPLAMVTVSGY
ncbi:hypothetical protein [Methylogaea oryzae]|uniref:hypothetical protein n=1 Tax=Methylogaea oryzae TaxID=1295382 RepID=UPI0012E311F6|nr:hypothetical protein [Methylogaea oryzae]